MPFLMVSPHPSPPIRPAQGGTVLAFDFGLKRIGVAVGETLLGRANALTTLDAETNEARFAATMRTPTLVIHGALDYRVPDAQGLAYYNTLKAKGVDARLVWFPDENHWILKPRNSKLWYEEYFGWLERHTKAAA